METTFKFLDPSGIQYRFTDHDGDGALSSKKEFERKVGDGDFEATSLTGKEAKTLLFMTGWDLAGIQLKDARFGSLESALNSWARSQSWNYWNKVEPKILAALAKVDSLAGLDELDDFIFDWDQEIRTYERYLSATDQSKFSKAVAQVESAIAKKREFFTAPATHGGGGGLAAPVLLSYGGGDSDYAANLEMACVIEDAQSDTELAKLDAALGEIQRQYSLLQNLNPDVDEIILSFEPSPSLATCSEFDNVNLKMTSSSSFKIGYGDNAILENIGAAVANAGLSKTVWENADQFELRLDPASGTALFQGTSPAPGGGKISIEGAMKALLGEETVIYAGRTEIDADGDDDVPAQVTGRNPAQRPPSRLGGFSPAVAVNAPRRPGAANPKWVSALSAEGSLQIQDKSASVTYTGTLEALETAELPASLIPDHINNELAPKFSSQIGEIHGQAVYTISEPAKLNDLNATFDLYLNPIRVQASQNGSPNVYHYEVSIEISLEIPEVLDEASWATYLEEFKKGLGDYCLTLVELKEAPDATGDGTFAPAPIKYELGTSI